MRSCKPHEGHYFRYIFLVFFMAGEVGFVKFWQCSARCVFFMVRQVGLVKVRYGTFCFGRCGALRYVTLCCGKNWFGLAGEVLQVALRLGIIR